MAKVALIGAGSIVFTKTLMNDLLNTPALAGSHYCLMSRTMPKLERMEGFLNRVIDANGLDATVSRTLDLEEAVTDADYVIVMIQVGGMDAFGVDYEVPLKYGVDQCIGDTLGPGGIFRALRTIPPVVDIAQTMERVAPGLGCSTTRTRWHPSAGPSARNRPSSSWASATASRPPRTSSRVT